MSIESVRIIDLPKVTDNRGNLTFIESTKHIPFDIARVYYLYDVPGGSDRGGHAHRELKQLIVAISGSFDVTLDDGVTRRKFHMNRPYFALSVCSMIWREIDNFSSASVCFVVASRTYDESDYFRRYEDFKSATIKAHSIS